MYDLYLQKIIFSTNKKAISRIAFTGPEINAIHSVGQAFSLIYEKEKSEKGVISVQTTEYEKNTTDKTDFCVDDKMVSVHFSIGRRVSTGIQDTPLKLTLIMVFEFEPTEAYAFIYRLYNIAKASKHQALRACFMSCGTKMVLKVRRT